MGKKIFTIFKTQIIFACLELCVIVFSDMDVEGMDVQIADQSGKPLQLPPAEKKVCSIFTAFDPSFSVND